MNAPPSCSSSCLTILLRQKNPLALECLEKHFRPLMEFRLRHHYPWLSEDDIYDIIGDGFLRTLSRGDKFDEKLGNLKTFVAMNVIVVTARNFMQRNGGTTYLKEYTATCDDILCERDEMFEQPGEIMRQLLQRLPEQQKLIVTMTYYENRCLDDVAATLGIKVSTVREQLSRAIRTLRTLLGN